MSKEIKQNKAELSQVLKKSLATLNRENNIASNQGADAAIAIGNIGLEMKKLTGNHGYSCSLRIKKNNRFNRLRNRDSGRKDYHKYSYFEMDAIEDLFNIDEDPLDNNL